MTATRFLVGGGRPVRAAGGAADAQPLSVASPSQSVCVCVCVHVLSSRRAPRAPEPERPAHSFSLFFPCFFFDLARFATCVFFSRYSSFVDFQTASHRLLRPALLERTEAPTTACLCHDEQSAQVCPAEVGAWPVVASGVGTAKHKKRRARPPPQTTPPADD